MFWFLIVCLILLEKCVDIQTYKIHFNIPSSCKNGFMLMNPDNMKIVQVTPIHSWYYQGIEIGNGCYDRSDQEGCFVKGNVSTLGAYRVIPNDVTKLGCNKTFVVAESTTAALLLSTGPPAVEATTTPLIVLTEIPETTLITESQTALETTGPPSGETSQIYLKPTIENPTYPKTYLDDNTKPTKGEDVTITVLYIVVGGSVAGVILVVVSVIVTCAIMSRKRRNSREFTRSVENMGIHSVESRDYTELVRTHGNSETRPVDHRDLRERATSCNDSRNNPDNPVYEIEDDPVYMEIDDPKLRVMSDEAVTYDYVINQDLKQCRDIRSEAASADAYYLTPVDRGTNQNPIVADDDYLTPKGVNNRTNKNLNESLQCNSSGEYGYHGIGQDQPLQRNK